MGAPSASPVFCDDDQRKLGRHGLECAEELARRAKLLRCVYDPGFLLRVIYPPDNPDFRGLWDRWSEVQEWVLSELCLQWKARTLIEVPPGWEVVLKGAKRKLDKYETYDLSQFRTLMIRPSRDTLKTLIRRTDAIHDLLWFVYAEHDQPAVAWYGHKLDMAVQETDTAKQAMCLTEFGELAPGIVPAHRNPERWGTKVPCKFNIKCRPAGYPLPSWAALAPDARYEGGRYRTGHFDDLVTGEDRDSAVQREGTAQNIRDRDNERDSIHGIRVIQGTDHHHADAYNQLEKRPGVICFRSPALDGETQKFWEFAGLPAEDQKAKVAEYTKVCQPRFKHLTVPVLMDKLNQQDRPTFCSQYFLDPKVAGAMAFDVQTVLTINADNIDSGWPMYLIIDPAFKREAAKGSGNAAAMVVCAFDKLMRRIIVDGVYSRELSETNAFEKIVELVRRWPTIIQIFSEKIIQHDLNEHWRPHSYQNACRLTYIHPLEKAGRSNKHSRIMGLDPELRSGRVVFVKDHPFTHAFIEEADQYNAVSGVDPDDALDVVSMTFDPADGVPLFRVRKDGEPKKIRSTVDLEGVR